MDWMLLPLRRYADFSGRSRRKEYWMFALGQVIVFAILAFLAGFGAVLSSSSDAPAGPLGWLGMVLLVLAILILIVPSIAVQVRRFHDQDKSGWLVLLSLIPYAGGIIIIVFMCLEGTRGENRYGPDPKAMGATSAYS